MEDRLTPRARAQLRGLPTTLPRQSARPAAEQVDDTVRRVLAEEAQQIVCALRGDLCTARKQCALIDIDGAVDVFWLRADVFGEFRRIEHREVGALSGERGHEVRGVAEQGNTRRWVPSMTG